MDNSIYDQDGLKSTHNHEFMNDPSFIEAYQRGVQAVGEDYFWHWRVHIGLWAARTAVLLEGDFVECGVNAGFLSSSIMHDLDWDSRNKTFFLLDTFKGLDSSQVTENEMVEGIMEKNTQLIESGFYVTSSEKARENFREWENTKIIEGLIPETLAQITTSKVAFVHIDLNCAPPEVASLEFLWDKLSTGAIVLLDDYAYKGFHNQKYALDDFTKSKGTSVASLPTGQGLIIKT